MIDVQGYDRRHALSRSELHHMQLLDARAQQGSKGWHKEARRALARNQRWVGVSGLLSPLFPIRTRREVLCMKIVHAPIVEEKRAPTRASAQNDRKIRDKQID